MAHLKLELSRSEIERFVAYATAHAVTQDDLFRIMSQEYMRTRSLGENVAIALTQHERSVFVDQSKSVQNVFNVFSGNSFSLVAKFVLKELHLLPENFADFWKGYRAGVVTVAMLLLIVLFARWMY